MLIRCKIICNNCGKIIEEKTNSENKKQKLLDGFADIDKKYKTTLEDASAENLGLEKLSFKKFFYADKNFGLWNYSQRCWELCFKQSIK